MESIQGFMLYGLCAVVVAAIAGWKGQSWSAYLLVILPLGPAVVMILPIITQGSSSSLVAGTLAFCVPLAALLVVIFSKTQKPLTTASEHGEHRGC
jgi:hypothetical protein